MVFGVTGECEFWGIHCLFLSFKGLMNTKLNVVILLWNRHGNILQA